VDGTDVESRPNPKVRWATVQLTLTVATVRDRVCMTAAMLVLEPIFEADLPPEQYAYRPGRNAQQAAVDVKDTLFYGHPEVVDADLADYLDPCSHYTSSCGLRAKEIGISSR
jgi:retron-type reverse transcriptase